MKERIYLSPPNIDEHEQKVVTQALASGWVAPVGPDLDRFEEDLDHIFQGRRSLLLNSGTSALHLSLILAGISEGDIVLTSSMTFGACANVILYQKAIPVFIDSEDETWNMDPVLLEQFLAHVQVRPKAIIVPHLYGVPAKIEEIVEIAHKHDIVVIEDAAEALGAEWAKQPLGTYGDFGVVSFNGNKIITTSGGGALICDEQNYDAGLHIATQANVGRGEYEHNQVGYNYRMSNILAGLGRAQLQKLSSFLEIKHKIFACYQAELSDYLDFPEERNLAKSNYWLSTGLIKSGRQPLELINWLEKNDIEARRLWKPLHLHKAYKSYKFIGKGRCESIFDHGICLPSGTGLTSDQQSRVISLIKNFFEK